MIGAIKDCFQLAEIICGEEPFAVERSRQSKWRHCKQNDLMSLLLHLLAFRRGFFAKQAQPPFLDDLLGVSLAAAESKTADQRRIVIVDPGNGDERVFRIELFDFVQRLRGRVLFRQSSQRLAQKFLHTWLEVELADIRLVPLPTGSIEIGEVRKRDCLAREKRAHCRARGFYGQTHGVQDRQRDNYADDPEQNWSFHEERELIRKNDLAQRPQRTQLDEK